MDQVNFQPPELPTKTQHFAFVAAVLALVAAAIYMLERFVPALMWAVVLAIATWPLFILARQRVGRNTAAAAITVLIVLVILVPLVIAAIQAVHEARGVISWIIETRKDGFAAPTWISGLPLVGPAIADWLNTHFKPEGNPFEAANIGSLTEWGGMIGRQAARRITTLAFALLIVFFVFRNSDSLMQQTRAVADRLFGPRGYALACVAAVAVRGTVDGLLLVGLAEAVLLGVAYAIAGVPHPGLLGVLTGLLSAIPFASPIVFIGAALWLLAQDQIFSAIGLLAFGTLVVFVADHFVRPVLIGGATRLPFVWVLLGILGGVESFGLLGLFLGPALLAVLITLWRELAQPVERVAV